MMLVMLMLSSCLRVPVHGPDIKTGTAAVNGTNLYYEISGSGDPVVLLEGGQLDRRLWDDQFEVLARSYRVVRMDVRGFGKSPDVSGPYQSHEDLHTLLKALDIPRAHLIGLSLGGRIAIDFALTYPDMVSSLVLVAPGLSGFPWSDTKYEWGERIHKALVAHDATGAVNAWLDSDYMKPAATNPRTRDRVRTLAHANARAWLQPDTERPLSPPAYPRVGEIHAPTLLLIGSIDNADIQRIVSYLVAQIRGAEKVEFEGAGHLPNIERSDEFNHAVLAFLSRAKKGS
jgi:pimeloyl-ACP methyl ester carboxylesterase